MDTVLIQPNLFVGATELKSLQEKPKVEINNLITNLVNTYGLVKKDADTYFTNFKVVVGSNPSYIKILAGRALNKNGKNIILGADLDNFYQIPDNSQAYYVYIEAADTQFEAGTVSISATGLMTGIGTDFTKFRVGDYPTRLVFDSLSYGSFYVEVATITSSTEVQLIGSTFPVVSGINYKIVGTYYADVDSAPLYSYDSYNIVVSQTDFNPTYVSNGLRFKLAKVSNTGGVLTIDDQRFEFLALDNYLTGKKFGAFIDGLDARNTILDADKFLILNSESNTAMSATGTKVQSWLKAYFDIIYTGFILTKAAIESVLTGQIDTHYHIVSKTAVGLSDVDNTSDLAKPVSTATQTALNLKQDILVSEVNSYTISFPEISGELRVRTYGKLVVIEGYISVVYIQPNVDLTIKSGLPSPSVSPVSFGGVAVFSTLNIYTNADCYVSLIGEMHMTFRTTESNYVFNFSYITE